MCSSDLALDNHQAEYQPTMIEYEGMIVKQPIPILFDSGASLSYVSPKVVEKCQLQSSKFPKTWLVQLATRTKRRVIAKTKHCPITISGQPIYVDFNILPLGSYDILIEMDWLEKCWSLLDCKQKTVNFIAEIGQRKEPQGIKTNTMLLTKGLSDKLLMTNIVNRIRRTIIVITNSVRLSNLTGTVKTHQSLMEH